MRMPMEASALDQTPSAMPSQVGSIVLVMLLSSTVLNIEHMVALADANVRCCERVGWGSARTYGILSRKTMRIPICVREFNCTREM